MPTHLASDREELRRLVSGGVHDEKLQSLSRLIRALVRPGGDPYIYLYTVQGHQQGGWYDLLAWLLSLNLMD